MMKSKSSVILLFALACMLVFSGSAFAISTITITAGDARTNTIDKAVSGKKNVVLTAFTATNNAESGAINDFKVVNTGGSATGARIAKMSLYNDVDGDGKIGSKDTVVMLTGDVTAVTSGAALANYDNGGTGVVLEPKSDIAFAPNEAKKFLIVVELAKVITDNLTFGAALSGDQANVANTVVGAAQAPKTLAIVASHFRFISANLTLQAANTTELLGANASNIILAVDDNGNTDVDFTDAVVLSAEDYVTGAASNTALTATEGNGAGAAVSVKTGNTAGGGGALNTLAVVAGVVTIDKTNNTADALSSIQFNADGDFILVATSQNLKLEGSIAIRSGANTTTQGILPGRGIEIYDVDHDGYIDYATLFFNSPVLMGGGMTKNDFTISGGYTIDTVVAQPFDAGGVGIRNAGLYGVTLALNEKDAYDTNATPDITFSGSNLTFRAGGAVLSIGSAQAVEVDKARPVLISAETKDMGYGSGTKDNGIIDGILFTFSEPVRNVTAGAALADGTSYIGLAIPVIHGMSFQNNGTVDGNIVTIPVGETTINTGITPGIRYNENFPNARITDFARSATYAVAYNSFYALNTQFAKGTSTGDNLDPNDPTITTVDAAPMVVHSVETRDTDNDGRLDEMWVTFSENTNAGATKDGVDFYSSVSKFASGNGKDGIYDAAAVSGGGTPTLKFTVTPVDLAEDVFDTEATPIFRYDENSGNIQDEVGNKLKSYGPGGLTHPATKDGAKPVIVKFITGDAYADTALVGGSSFESVGPNGRIDNVTIVFSEKVKTGSGGQYGGTALDNAIAQLTLSHEVAGNPTKMLSNSVIGKPSWADKEDLGDTRTEVNVPFQEISFVTLGALNNFGDTGKYIDVAYAASVTTAYNFIDYAAEANYLTAVRPRAAAWYDGAAPFISDGLGKTWHTDAFANILTVDTDVTYPAHATVSNNADGDGWIDAMELRFSEPVALGAGNTNDAFSVKLDAGAKLPFNVAPVVAGNKLTIKGTPDPDAKGDPNTGQAPLLSYNAEKLVITDVVAAGRTANKAVSFTDRKSYDAAPPVIVSVNGDLTNSTKLNITFSEPVYAHDADNKTISVGSRNLQSSQVFGYENLNAGLGASGFTASVLTQPTNARVIQATLNSALTVGDIEKDLIWVRIGGTYGLWDDANLLEDGLADNVTESDVGGANLKFWIMDDVVAPWIIGARTIDYNRNGKIDHIRIALNENIVDSSIKGFVADNQMSADVSATWKISGYSGPVRWNFLDGTKDPGRAASLALSKPAFDDNGKNDAVLYLELDEELVPANLNTGIGSTAFKPTITWGVGADAETMADARPNVLNTAADPEKTTPKATNGTVEDKVGPTIVGATISGKDITVLFSEDLKKPDDVKYAQNFWIDGSPAKIWAVAKINNSSYKLTMKSDYGFKIDQATLVQINETAVGTNNEKQPDLAVFNDAADNVPGDVDDLLLGVWVANSPAAKEPYTATTTKRGAYKVTNNTWITFNASGSTGAGATVAAGATVKYNFTFANIDSVDVYISYNNGATYELLPGARFAASGKFITLTARMGITNIKVASAANAGVNFANGINVVFDGSEVGASIAAPTSLAMFDVPNDNGGFVYAQFGVSTDHLIAVKSYQFYRKITLGEAETWVLWATVPAGAPDADGKQTVIVPTMWNGTAQWAVRASTGLVVSNETVASKAADVAVATVVYNTEGAAKAAGYETLVSALSDVAEGGSVDDIAPSAVTDAKAVDNAGAGTGIQISWTAPADNGIVGQYMLNNQVNYIYGVESYDIYRKAMGSTEDYVLVGSATHGATSYTDMVADGAAAYNYIIKATDGTFVVLVGIPGNAMAGNGTPDFDNSGTVSLGDLVLLGKVWGLKSTDAGFIANFDLNNDGTIGLGDLVMLGNSWTSSTKAAKLAPMQSVALDMSAELNEATSMYYVTIGSKDALEGLAFTLNYDTNLYEFVKESVTGLGSVSVANEMKTGVIDIASVYGNEKFSGAITLGFKSKGKTGDMNIQLANTEVSLNGVLGSVNDQTMVLKALPTVYSLGKNFPNPFNPTTTIEYSIPVAGQTNLVIYNLAGQKVRTLVNSVQAPSFYKVVWDGKNDNGMTVATGTYFYKLVSGNYSKTVKMTLVK